MKKRKPYHEDIFGDAIIVKRVLERGRKNTLTIRGTKSFEITGSKYLLGFALDTDYTILESVLKKIYY